MRVTTNRKGDYCWACGKQSGKIIKMDLGGPAATFELCRSCAGKLQKMLLRELTKEKAPERRQPL
jgi:hypothetical protein